MQFKNYVYGWETKSEEEKIGNSHSKKGWSEYGRKWEEEKVEWELEAEKKSEENK